MRLIMVLFLFATGCNSAVRRKGVIVIDYETGCEYLGSDCLIPRVDASGKHICRSHDEN